MLRARDAIAIQAAVMYRTDRLRSVDKDGADNEAHFSIAAERLASHDCCVAEYRHDKRLMLTRSIVGPLPDESQLHEVDGAKQFGQTLVFYHDAPQVFASAARELVKNGPSLDLLKLMLRAARMAPFMLLKTVVLRSVKAIIRRMPRWIGRHFGETLWAPGVGSVDFGDFGRIKPISVYDGSDRGKPVDRYYIERALAERSALIRGRVLEVGGRQYTESFGGEKVARSEVLDIDPLNPAATIIGDLGVAGSLPEGAFDCIVLTQTLQYIYDLQNALNNLYRALAPGGTLLITVPGISPIGTGEKQVWYWEFTELSLKALLRSRFDESDVEVHSYGNVFAAISFLTGLSLVEVGAERLQHKDERYPVTVFACARKPEAELE